MCLRDSFHVDPQLRRLLVCFNDPGSEGENKCPLVQGQRSYKNPSSIKPI